MHTPATEQSHMEPSPMESEDSRRMEMRKEMPAGHGMSMHDPDNPMNWPLPKKLYASASAFLFTLTLLFSATAYTAGVMQVVKEFNVSMQQSILGFSLFLFGIFFAPFHTPHVSERVGRNPIYFVGTFVMSLFLIGASQAKSHTALAACRFFAGFFGGPAVVNIEGTFADIWPALHTLTYYAALTMASYLGASLGPIICGTVVTSENWRYTQYVPLMLAAFALIFGALTPETYPRQIIRNRARKAKMPHNLPPAASGDTFLAAANLTVLQPLRMMVTEPVVIGTALVLSLNFGVLFAWFIAVPVVLNMTYNFSLTRGGLAFFSAFAAIFVAALTTVAIDAVARRLAQRRARNSAVAMSIEYRLVPAMLGSAWILASLFWIGFTAKPTVFFDVPIAGTSFYVWGSFIQLCGFISYLFDAFTPQGILAALTAAATMRVFFAGLIPLFILTAIMHLTGAWALATFGFIATAFLPWPFFLFFFGEKLRERSAFAPAHLKMRRMGGMGEAVDMASVGPMQQQLLEGGMPGGVAEMGS